MPVNPTTLISSPSAGPPAERRSTATLARSPSPHDHPTPRPPRAAPTSESMPTLLGPSSRRHAASCKRGNAAPSARAVRRADRGGAGAVGQESEGDAARPEQHRGGDSSGRVRERRAIMTTHRRTAIIGPAAATTRLPADRSRHRGDREDDGQGAGQPTVGSATSTTKRAAASAEQQHHRRLVEERVHVGKATGATTVTLTATSSETGGP